jgi:hypothetical protein
LDETVVEEESDRREEGEVKENAVVEVDVGCEDEERREVDATGIKF